MRRELLIGCFLFAPVQLCAQALPTASAASAPGTWGRMPLGTTIGGQLRVRIESYDAAGFNGNNSDTYALTRVLLNARVHPTRSTALFVEGMDARGPWKNKTPAGAPFRDFADLRQLYAQVGADNAATILRAGRQELFYGDGRLVGPLLWANTARTSDAARISTSGQGYRVDAFAASVVKIDQTRFDKNIPATISTVPTSVPRESFRAPASSLSSSGDGRVG